MNRNVIKERVNKAAESCGVDVADVDGLPWPAMVRILTECERINAPIDVLRARMMRLHLKKATAFEEVAVLSKARAVAVAKVVEQAREYMTAELGTVDVQSLEAVFPRTIAEIRTFDVLPGSLSFRLAVVCAGRAAACERACQVWADASEAAVELSADVDSRVAALRDCIESLEASARPKVRALFDAAFAEEAGRRAALRN